MDTAILRTHFARMGARLQLTNTPSRNPRPELPITLDVRQDSDGEFFEIAVQPRTELDPKVIDLRPGQRHLLLMVERQRVKHKFLCGHDERHWFVAALPEKSFGVGSVRTAMEALKPMPVRFAEIRHRVKFADRIRRKNAAFVRQGEWFFLPAGNLQVPEWLVLRDEPLSRGAGSKPHLLEFAYRTSGETVYVCSRHPRGVTQGQYQRLLERKGDAKNWGWTIQKRNPLVYVRGRVRHADHKTITLPGWHRVMMNTEGQAVARANVVFLD